MDLYFAPMTCSIASRIALYEAGVDATFHQVDRATKRLADGSDYHEVNPLGLVPALRTDDGVLVTENAAVLTTIAALDPDAPKPDPIALARWLSFIATELHKGIFAVLFDPTAPPEAKRWVLEHKAPPRLALIDAHLQAREHVVDVPSVADAYLFAVLSWIPATPLSLDAYPALARFHARCMEVPSYARAYGEELPLYRAAQSA